MCATKTKQASRQNEAGVTPKRRILVCPLGVRISGQNEAGVTPKRSRRHAKTKHGRSQNNVYAMPRRRALRIQINENKIARNDFKALMRQNRKRM